MKKIIIVVVALIMIITYAFSRLQSEKFSDKTLKNKLITLDNKAITFEDILKKHKGKTTVIEIWASWCSDCVKAMPKVKEMQANNPNVNYVFISMDKSFEKWQAGIDKHDVKGYNYWVTDGMKGEFGSSIDVDWIPRYIILDKTGKILLYRAIESDFDKINEQLKNLK
jgi:thiol-disulfide isomerase/thioredoxin